MAFTANQPIRLRLSDSLVKWTHPKSQSEISQTRNGQLEGENIVARMNLKNVLVVKYDNLNEFIPLDL